MGQSQSPSVGSPDPSSSASLTKGKEVGRGAYGVVYQGQLGSRPVAIKKIRDLLRTDGDPQLAQFRREYEILQAAKHQHVVECIEWRSEGNDVLLVMELMDQTLEAYLSANQGLPVAKQLEICFKLANGLHFLHQHTPQILHRDLTAKNVLLNKDGDIVKISDFGLANFRPTSKEFLSSNPGCVVYMPPESLADRVRFNNKGDVFSHGVLMLQIATQAKPSCGYYGIGVHDEMERRAADLALLPKGHVLKPLILQCLRDDLKARPDAFSIYFCLSLMLPEASDMHKQYRPLEECCHNGNTEQLLQALGLAEEVLHLPVNLSQQNGDSGDTCLHIAAAGGHADCVRMLLDKGADCFVRNDEGATALHVASDDHVLSCLLSAATLKAVDNDSIEMLNIVCEFPRHLFEAENLQKTLAMAVAKDSALNVAQLARGSHQLPNISKALTHAKEIHTYGAYTVLLMLQAAYADDSQLVLALFGTETVTIPLINDSDIPHIQSVLRNEDFPIEILLKVAKELESMKFCTAVESVLSTSVMGSLSSDCSDSNAGAQELPEGSRNVGDSGSHDSPGTRRALSNQLQRFHGYCNEGSVEKINELLSTMRANKVDIKAKLNQRVGVFGYTPLHEAASAGQTEVLELLLKEGGPVNAEASSRYTPLHLAASGGHSECARLLLKHGADLTAKDENQKTPLDTAKLIAKTRVERILESYAIIKAVETNSAQLNELLAAPKESLDSTCLQTALKVAVEKNSAVNAGKLILKGRESLDISAALTRATEVQSHAVQAMLLLVKAAYDDDLDLVATLYGASIPHHSIPLIRDPDLCSIQLAIQEKEVTTAVPIEIARREKRVAVREELLLRTDVNMAEGTVQWYGLRLTELEVSWLRRIHWVRKLQLARNDFQTLPPQMGNYLKRVTKINLQYNSLRQIPHCLLKLPCIENLNLSYNKLQEIPEVHEWATPLAVLDLSHNELQSLPQYCAAPNLKCLSISHNKFRQVPKCICSFTNLTTLKLGHNADILKLPKEMGRLQNLTTLELEGLDDINDPPKRNRVNAKECITYLNQKLRSTQEYYCMKLVLLGTQETGKTTLVARLQRKNVKEGNYQPTVGIDVSEWQIRPKTGKKTFTFRVWDFGGQEEYYATHQCFLTERSLYLLLWNITHGEAGIRELTPWLDNIALRAPNSKVIIIATFYDKVSEEDRENGGRVHQLLQQVRQLAQSYQKNLQVMHITYVGLHGKQLQNLDNLKRLIYEKAESYTIKGEKVMGRQIPASYHALETRIARLRKDSQQSKRSPIMHALEFREVINGLNISDISSDEELKAATLFLREMGSLLHYDDRKNNLDDLYFVDPRWLCDMMTVMVTVKEANPYFKNGIINRFHLSLLYFGMQFPTELLDQYLVLLDRFEVALPLDQAMNRILIPSMLPNVRPDGINRPTDQVCHERHILFPVPTPPGFWSRLLARVMHTVQCLRDLVEASHGKVTIEVNESQTILCTSHSLRHTWSGASGVKAKGKRISSPSARLVQPGSWPEDTVLSLETTEPKDDGTTSEHVRQQGEEAKASVPLPKVAASLPMMKVGDAVFNYWKSGCSYCDSDLYFHMEDIEKQDGVAELHGVCIVVTPGREGCKVYGQLVDLILNLVEERYPSILGMQAAEKGLEQRAVCYRCLTEGSSNPYVFSKEKLVQYITACNTCVPCPNGHEMELADLFPDVLLVDINKRFLLGEGDVAYDSQLTPHGTLASTQYSHCRKMPVAVKLFQVQSKNDLFALNQLRNEALVLQRNQHPSLACMVGVLIFPQPCLVTEKAPLGSLDGPLIKHRTSIPRLVLFKLASQIAAALSFLHSNSFIYRNLKAANILLWSLDMDHIVDCKLADCGTTTQSAPMGVKGTCGTPGFIAPEVAYVGGNRCHATYDFKADIFSYAMVLYQIVTRHNPFYSIKESDIPKIMSYIEQGRRPDIVEFPVAHTGFHFLTGLMKRCWKHRPTDRPTTDEILAQLANPSVKLMMGVHPIASDYSLRTACCYISKPSLQHAAPAAPTDSLDPPNVELWLCCDSDKGAEITVYDADNMAILRQNMIKDNQVQCMAVCGDNVWVASRAGLEFKQLDIFSASTRQPVHHIRMKNTAVSCITCSDTHVYIGTKEGFIFIYELTLSAIQSSKPTRRYVTKHRINDLIISPTSLWVSHTRQLLFCDQTNLETLSSTVLPDNIPGNVGHLTLSSSKSLVWSAHVRDVRHLGGHILCAWQTLQQTVKFTIDVERALLKMEPDTQPNDCIITAMCSALDTVWCGMITGHILVFSEEQDFLLHFRPYQEYIRFLLPIASLGPCSSEECMVVSGGKKYIKNEYLEDVSDDVHKPDTAKNPKEDSPKESGTVIVWEALRASHMHQVRIIGRGDTWASHENMRRCEQEWEESKRKSEQAQSLNSLSCPSRNGEAIQFMPSSCISTSEECASTSTEDRISVLLPDCKELLVVCQKPVLLKKLQEGVCTQVMGSLSSDCSDSNAGAQELPEGSRNVGDSGSHDSPGTRRAVSNQLQRFHGYCNEGNIKKVRELISIMRANKVDIKAKLNQRVGVFGYTPLHEAASTGQTEVLERLLKEGGPVNAEASSRYTPLHLAASGGHSECARLLLEHGADLTPKDEHQKTPLDTAKLIGKTGVERILKSYAIIKAVETNSKQLNELLAVPKETLEPKCLQTALTVAVKKNSAVNAGKIIIKGRESLDINAALTHAMEVKSHTVCGMLLLVKAAYDDDVNLVAILYGAIIPDLRLVQLAIQEKRVATAVPIEIARQEKRLAVREELLLKTDVDMEEGTVLWHGLHLTELEVSWLKRIPWVRKLRLARNAFRTLPFRIGSYLKFVTKINLESNFLREFPCCLLELPCIEDLNLSDNKLLEIPEVHYWATSLAVLDLSHNELQSLPQYCEAPNLKRLSISHNKFRQVPKCICSFTNLTTLELGHNADILNLPVEMGRLQNLTMLDLNGLNDINDPPKKNRVNAKECITYLNQKLRNTQAYYRMKLILCGKAETGKTTLVSRLLNLRKNVKEGNYRPTVGIDVSEWRFSPRIRKQTFTFNVWDFGGQEEYYAAHQCFLTERSLYLLVWNITHGEEGICELKPWLDNIALRAPNSKVIIVATFYDKVSDDNQEDGGKVDQLLQQVSQLALSYQSNLQGLRVTRVALHGRQLQNLDNLKRIIYEEAESYTIKSEKVMGRQIPASYHALDSHMAQIQKEVRQDKRSPIMLAPDYREMINDLNLSDISSDEEVNAATLFLHEVGSLLHYDDRKNNLDDLYFVDPRWLCDMMSTVVTIEERNPFIKNGIVTQAELSLLYRSKQFPSEFLDQYLVLLDRFEIALSLDQAKHRILIPSKLPDVRPDGIGRPSDQVCRERQILFSVPTPPGFWSRLLARVMHTVQCLRDLIEASHGKVTNDVFKSQPGLCPSRSLRHTWSGTSSIKAKRKRISSPSGTLVQVGSLPEDTVLSLETTKPKDNGTTSDDAQQQGEEAKASVPLPKVAASLPMMKVGDAVFNYWKSGCSYCDPDLYFHMEDIEKQDGVAELHGVCIVVTPGREGCKVYGQLVDLILNLVEERYPSILGMQAAEKGLEQRAVCYRCLTEGSSNPYVFSKESLVQYITACNTCVPCPKGHEMELADLFPDVLLADIDKHFLLGDRDVAYERGSQLTPHGTPASTRYGRCRKMPVAVKLFQVQSRNDLFALNQLRNEALVLQRNQHPSLIGMVGVLILPQPSLVTEKAPLGSLDRQLHKPGTSIPRFVLFKLASQIAAALKFLHSNSFIYRNLKAANILLWSLDMDHIVNCKLADFGITTQSAPMGVKGTCGTPGFIAPEVAYVGGNRCHATYDFKADIFSYAMVLYQIVTRHNPFYSIKATDIPKITSYIEQGRRPRLVEFPVAHIGFHFLTSLMKRCWKHSPTDRPTTDEILAQLAKPSVKMMMGVHPIARDFSLRTACCYISKPSLQHAAPAAPTDSLDPPNVELWLCCDSDKGAEITVYQADNMAILRQNMIKDNQVQCMTVCGANVWVASRTKLEFGQLDIFSANTRQLMHRIRMKNTAVSCITCSNTHIYIGTMEGYIFMYELTLSAMRFNDRPTRCYITEHCINGLIISPTSLWVSHTHQLLFCDPTNLQIISSAVLPGDIPGYIGHLTLSSSKSLVWSAHVRDVRRLGGHFLCAWQTLQQTIKFTIDTELALLKVEPDTQPNDCIITAMCSALDTVWCGMATGHILVFSEEQDFLLHFRPYQEYVHFLLPIASLGPCSSEECMVVSGGKKYIKNEYLEDVSDDVHKPDTAKNPDKDSPKESGTVIVWEALRACHMHQVRILGRGDTWASHENVQRCEQEWEESKRKSEQAQSLESLSCPSKVAETATSSHVQSEQRCDSTSTEEGISVLLPDGQEHIVICQKPVLLKELQEGVCIQGSISGSVSLFWRNEGGTVKLSTQDQLAKYLAFQDRPPMYTKLDKLN